MKEVDLLVLPRWLISLEGEDAETEDRALAVADGRIAALGARAEMEAQYSARERVELPAHALMPGLVNAHTHAAMTLLRGYADDLPLLEWLTAHI